MQDPWLIKLKTVPRTVWTNPEKNKLHSDPDKLNTTILNGIKKDDSVNKLFRTLPGPTKSAFPKNELNVMAKKLTQDKNKNKKPDVIEKYLPFTKKVNK